MTSSIRPSVHPSSRRRSSVVGRRSVAEPARAARREPSSVRRRRERRAASIVNHARVHPSIGPSTPRARRAIARLACKNTTNQNKISTSRISDRSSSLASPPRRRRVTTARSISRSTRPPRPPRDRSFARSRDRSNVRANPVPRFQIHVHTDRSPVSTHRHTRRRTTRLTTTTSHDDIPRRRHHRRRRRCRRRPRPRTNRNFHDITVDESSTIDSSARTPQTMHPVESHTVTSPPPTAPTPVVPSSSRARSTPGAVSTRDGAGSLNPIHTVHTRRPVRRSMCQGPGNDVAVGFRRMVFATATVGA